jgi:hypothetical protein
MSNHTVELCSQVTICGESMRCGGSPPKKTSLVSHLGQKHMSGRTLRCPGSRHVHVCVGGHRLRGLLIDTEQALGTMRADDSGPTPTEGREGGSRAAPAHPARRHEGASRWRSTRRRCARSRPAPAASSQPAREDPAGVTRSPWAGARRRRRRWKTAVPQWFACVKGRETDLACWLLGVVDGDRAQEHRVHSACDHHVATDVEEQAWVAVGHDRHPPRRGDIEWRAAEVVVLGRDDELGSPR